MLAYLYTFDYDDKNDKMDPIVFHVHVHNIAHHFGIADLEALAAAKFETLAPSVWTTEVSPDGP